MIQTADTVQPKIETILVVEDVDMIRQLIVKVLCSKNFVVLQAIDGPDALKLASHYRGTIDLLIADIRLPGMSGLELFEALKRFRPEIHVLLMSAFTGEILDTPDWSFIQKPFTSKELLEKISGLIDTPHLIT